MDLMKFFELMLSERGLATTVCFGLFVLGFIYGLQRIKKNEQKKVRINLENHPFFTKMDLFKRTIELIDIKNEIKKQMIIDFFSIYLTVFRNGIKEVVISHNFNELQNNELSAIFMRTVAELLTKYDDKSRAIGVPDYFLHQFNKFHNSTLEIVFEDIDNILNNDVYGTQEQKVYVVLDTVKSAFHLMIKDAKISMDSINGQLNNEFYK